jgi:hypothetical protein
VPQKLPWAYAVEHDTYCLDQMSQNKIEFHRISAGSEHSPSLS